MAFAPVNPSSSGWNTSFTVPLSSLWYSFRSLAAPSSMAVCMSWPQACMAPFSDLKARSVMSVTFSASMSARSRMHRPVSSPVMEATMPLSQISDGSYPSSERRFLTYILVLGRQAPTSGCRCSSLRSATISSLNCSAEASSVFASMLIPCHSNQNVEQVYGYDSTENMNKSTAADHFSVCGCFMLPHRGDFYSVSGISAWGGMQTRFPGGSAA